VLVLKLSVHIVDDQTSGGAGGDDGFAWTDGPVMCMLATRAGPDRLITLFAATADKRLVISSYPVFLVYFVILVLALLARFCGRLPLF